MYTNDGINEFTESISLICETLVMINELTAEIVKRVIFKGVIDAAMF